MSLTEKEAAATSTTKANTGGISGFLVPLLSAAITKGVESHFMIDLSIEVELAIVSVVTSVVTYWTVWFLPNRPKEPAP